MTTDRLHIGKRIDTPAELGALPIDTIAVDRFGIVYHVTADANGNPVLYMRERDGRAYGPTNISLIQEFVLDDLTDGNIRIVHVGHHNPEGS